MVRKREKVGKMLFGEYEHNLDDKGRLLIPSKLKNELSLSPSLYLLKGFDGCISIYPEEHFQKLVDELNKHSYFSKDARDLIRITLSSVAQLNIDKVGRIQFTPSVLAKYGINKTVIIIGVNDHIEVWDKNAYESYLNDKTNSYEDIADKLNASHE